MDGAQEQELSNLFPDTGAQAMDDVNSIEPGKVTLAVSAPASNNSTILWVIGGVVCVAVLCSVTYLGGRPGDHSQLITTIFGFAATFMTALIAVIKGSQNSAAIKQLHVAVNGRLTQLLEAIAANATLRATNAVLTTKAEDKAIAIDPSTGAVAVKVPTTLVINRTVATVVPASEPPKS